MVAPSSERASDPNLLFAVLALERGFLDQDKFVDACTLAARRGTPMPKLLVERSWITPAQQQDVQQDIDRRLKKHHGDVRASIDEVAGADPVVRQSLGHLFRDLRESDLRKSGDYKIPPPSQRYQKLGKPKEGGIGRVWRTRDTHLGRVVALKELRSDPIPSAEQRERFLAEAQINAQLMHPNIIPAFELGDQGGLDGPFYTMQFVEGPTLDDAIRDFHARRKQGPAGNLELRRLLSAYTAVCKAVDYAHSRDILHRDLKGSNVILGEHGEVFLLDWGLAKVIGDHPANERAYPVVPAAVAAATETQAGDLVGTPPYMAPEQAEGKIDQIDRRTDVYALGVILYEILTSRLPFDAETTPSLFADLPADPAARKEELRRKQVERILHQIIHDPAPAPRSIDSLVPISLEKVCLKAMAKVKDERYPSAGELANEIERWLADEPVSAWPEPWTVRAGRWMRRHRPWVAGAVSLLAAALPLLTILIVFSENAREKLEVEQGETKRERDRAITNEKLATEREILAKKMTLQARFDHLYFRAREEPAVAMVGSAQLLPETLALNDRLLADSILLHLGVWFQEVHRLRAGCLHQGEVCAVAFSRDGKTVLTGSYDKTARLWDAATGKELGPPLPHGGEVWAVAFSPDGKTVLTGSADGTARLWKAATGKQLGPLLKHQGVVCTVAFSPDGKTVLTGSFDGTARLWKAATGKQLGPPLQHRNKIRAVAFSPDGKTVLIGSDDKRAQLWEAATGKPLWDSGRQSGAIWAVAFSPDGKTALTGSGSVFFQDGEGEASLWEAATGKRLGPPLQGHFLAVRAVAFSPDGKTVLTGSFDGTARLWDAATGKQLGPRLEHESMVEAVAFSPDGKTVLTGSFDRTARLWEVGTGRQIGSPLQHQGWVRAVAFSPDGKTVLTGSYDKMARLWVPATGKQLGPSLRQNFDNVIAVAFTKDGKTVLTASTDSIVDCCEALQWNVATGTQFGPPLPFPLKVRAVAFSPDGKTVLTGSKDKTARLWDAAKDKQLGPALQHGGEVSAVAFSPDGKTVLTGSDDKTARLWEVRTGKQLGPPLHHQYGVNAVAFSPDGKTVLTGSDDKTARLWEVRTGKQLGQPLEHSAWVVAVAFSPDGKTVLTGSEDGTARLWEVRTGKQLGPPLQHRKKIRAVAFSPDGKTVLTGSDDKMARLWEVRTGKQLGQPLEHSAWVVAVAFSPDGKTVLTGSADGTARLWRLPQVQSDPEQILLWTQVLTGLELDERGNVRVLDAATWLERRKHLQKLGGSPES